MLNIQRSRALCALSTAAALVAFTGGCGSDKKKEASNTTTSPAPATTATPSTGGGDVASYKAGAAKAANDFKNSAQSASGQVQAAKDTAGKVKGLEALKASVNQAADDFSKLSPPANVKADNDELVKEFRSLAGNVDAVEQALKSNDSAAAQAALPRLAQDQSKIGQTISSIQPKIGQ
jgi:hypothetical protein